VHERYSTDGGMSAAQFAEFVADCDLLDGRFKQTDVR
jgi:hypothetical protein